jgi:1,4-alpha-glucan branching enzyme
MPGDYWQKLANLRLLYGCMYGHPGAKLLFMGAEFGQEEEWNFQQSLDWHLTQNPSHIGIQNWIKSLNTLYRKEAALHEKQFTHEGFQWISHNDNDNCILAFVRKGNKPKDDLVFVCNFTPVIRENYRIGLPAKGLWVEYLNSDHSQFGGSGVGNEPFETEEIAYHGYNQSGALNLPPLATIILKRK